MRQPYIDVTIENSKYLKVDGLYQYDHGIKLHIYGVEQNKIFSVHFAP